MPLPPAYAEVGSHTPCHRCGYDLFGLAADGTCPECAAPIKPPGFDARFADNLTDAPLGYLRSLTLGFWLLSVSILIGVLAVTLGVFGVFALGVMPGYVADAAVLVTSVAWAGGVWITTTKRERTPTTAPDPLLDSTRLRHAIRATQSLAPFAAMAGVSAPYAAPAGATALVGVAAILGLVAFLGAAALCAYLSCLGDWAGDSGVAERMRASAWGIGVCGLISIGGMVLSLAFPAAAIVSSWTTLLLLLAVGLMVYAIFELARLTSWAVANHISGVDRDDRVASRQRQRAAEMAERVERLDHAVPYAKASAPPAPEPDQDIPLADDPDAEIDQALPAPAGKRASKVRLPTPTYPPVGRRYPHQPVAPPPSTLPDMGEEHYREFRYEPRTPDPGGQTG